MLLLLVLMLLLTTLGLRAFDVMEKGKWPDHRSHKQNDKTNNDISKKD